MTKLFNAISRKIKSDGLLLGMYLLSSRVFQRGKSFFYQLALQAPGINVGPGCQFTGKRFIRFGSNISIYRNLWLEAVSEYAGTKFNPVIQLGNRVKFSNGVHISAIKKIIIGNNVLFGSNVFLSDHNHGGYSGGLHTSPLIPPADRILYSEGAVIIEDNVWIGDNVNIVGPVIIGFGAVIAANSVVRKDVPMQTIVAGSPARIIKIFNESTLKWEKYV
jgi:lipopolysaccharide O-acetyltransferase